MNKKNIKIILCLFIILGIFAISKNIFAETLLVEANNKDRRLFIEEGETVTLTREQIMGEIAQADSKTDIYKNCFIESYTVENGSYIKVEGTTTGFGSGKNYDKLTITGIKEGNAKIIITSQGTNKETRYINIFVKKDPNINSYPIITVEDIGDYAAVKKEIDSIMKDSDIIKNNPQYINSIRNKIIKITYIGINTEIATAVEDESYVKICGVSEGTTILNIGLEFNINVSGGYMKCTPTIKYKVVVKDKSVEEKELVSKIEDTNKTIDAMKNAYKNIPNKSASAQEIDKFIKSDATYNSSKALNNITDEELLKSWETTIESAMIDTISKDMYKNTLLAIKERKNGDNVSSDTQKGLSDQFLAAVQSSESTGKEYEDILAELRANRGEQRNEVSFNDVLDNLSDYKPEDLDDESSRKIEIVTSNILTTISNIGIIVAIVMLAILGIKYMIGSVEEKAEYKKDLIPYFIGALILFGITSLVKTLMVLGQQIEI